MDLINSMLWTLCRYDGALDLFADIRQHYGKNPDVREHLDAALIAYIIAESKRFAPDGLPDDTEIEQRCPNAKVTLKKVRDLAMEAYSDPFSSAIDVQTHLAIIVANYALILGTFSTFGNVPWRRVAELVEEHAQQ